MSKKKKCYYARPIHLDGTPQFDRDCKLIESMGYQVWPRPKDLKSVQLGYKVSGMEIFRKYVEESDILIFRPFMDGKIGAGVKWEINVAQEKDIPVLEIPRHIKDRTLTVEETVEYLKELGQR